jgi:Ca2+:H+ antiporter
MSGAQNQALPRWSVAVPPIALAVLLGTFGRTWGPILIFDAFVLVAAVLAAVHHAEVVALRVGEPFGTLILAIAVTVIEVGVFIALLVLLPETGAAVRAAGRNRVQTSLNLAYGSALASIGLTIPAVALASIWVGGPLTLGLNPKELVLLALTVVVSILTVAPGRATLMQGSVHLAIFGACLFLSFTA